MHAASSVDNLKFWVGGKYPKLVFCTGIFGRTRTRQLPVPAWWVRVCLRVSTFVPAGVPVPVVGNPWVCPNLSKQAIKLITKNNNRMNGEVGIGYIGGMEG